MHDALLNDTAPLEPDWTPPELVEREEELAELVELVGTPGRSAVHLRGPPGSGRTSVARRALSAVDVDGEYVSCVRADTQYKVLQALLEGLAGRSVSSGHHVADLQNWLEDAVAGRDLVIVLDDVEFLLLNDGNDLLYFLSRLENGTVSLILVSRRGYDLRDSVSERVWSSLQPSRVTLVEYETDELYSILLDRAKRVLGPNTVARDGFEYLCSRSVDARFARCWFRAAVKEAADAVTASVVERSVSAARHRYEREQLEGLSAHHALLWEVLASGVNGENGRVTSGEVYRRYAQACESRGWHRLSDRRVSDFLKHLEFRGFVDAQYRYGGTHGKTRYFELQPPFRSSD